MPYTAVYTRNDGVHLVTIADPYTHSNQPVLARRSVSAKWGNRALNVRLSAPPMPPTPTTRSPPGTQPSPSSTIDPGALVPGEMHQISQVVLPTPQNIIDGSYQRSLNEAKDVVLYAPRCKEHSHPPYIPSVIFREKGGRVGPYVREMMKGRVRLEGPLDKVLVDRGWKQTSWMIDWPGVRTDREVIPCFRGDGQPVARAEIAVTICTGLCSFFINGKRGKLPWGPQIVDTSTKDWDLRTIDCRDLRIIGINYYRNTWIPVLALDAEYDVAAAAGHNTSEPVGSAGSPTSDTCAAGMEDAVGSAPRSAGGYGRESAGSEAWKGLSSAGYTTGYPVSQWIEQRPGYM